MTYSHLWYLDLQVKGGLFLGKKKQNMLYKVPLIYSISTDYKNKKYCLHSTIIKIQQYIVGLPPFANS